MKQKLERCPFCGSSLIKQGTKEAPRDQLYFIECINCGAKSGFADRVEDAIEFWNRRDKE
jgi:Lar family restriction alleviation protein